VSKVGDFRRALDEMFQKRVKWLKHAVGDKAPGRPSEVNKRARDKAIVNLQALAESILAKGFATREFKAHTGGKRQWHVTGHGHRKQMEKFDAWYAKKCGDFLNCIYIYWKGKKPLYVGRTTKGGSRPSSHLSSKRTNGATRVDVYAVPKRSELSKLECLAWHRFDPSRNNVRPAGQKYDKKCPMCKVNKNIKSELSSMFRLKG
jgi:hypothetical protein